MQYANHNSNRFMATTDDVGQSLVNDFWTIVNKTDRALDIWQDAADNGYGVISWWGEATDLVLDKFDWFCANVLRNLVAIAVYFALVAIQTGQQAYAHYIATGKAQVHADAVVAIGRQFVQAVKPISLEVAATVAVMAATWDAPLCLAFDVPLPTVDMDADLIDGVPADVWMMRRIIVR